MATSLQHHTSSRGRPVRHPEMARAYRFTTVVFSDVILSPGSTPVCNIQEKRVQLAQAASEHGSLATSSFEFVPKRTIGRQAAIDSGGRFAFGSVSVLMPLMGWMPLRPAAQCAKMVMHYVTNRGGGIQSIGAKSTIRATTEVLEQRVHLARRQWQGVDDVGPRLSDGVQPAC